jgi:hypothetical protein
MRDVKMAVEEGLRTEGHMELGGHGRHSTQDKRL